MANTASVKVDANGVPIIKVSTNKTRAPPHNESDFTLAELVAMAPSEHAVFITVENPTAHTTDLINLRYFVIEFDFTKKIVESVFRQNQAPLFFSKLVKSNIADLRNSPGHFIQLFNKVFHGNDSSIFKLFKKEKIDTVEQLLKVTKLWNIDLFKQFHKDLDSGDLYFARQRFEESFFKKPFPFGEEAAKKYGVYIEKSKRSGLIFNVYVGYHTGKKKYDKLNEKLDSRILEQGNAVYLRCRDTKRKGIISYRKFYKFFWIQNKVSVGSSISNYSGRNNISIPGLEKFQVIFELVDSGLKLNVLGGSNKLYFEFSNNLVELNKGEEFLFDPSMVIIGHQSVQITSNVIAYLQSIYKGLKKIGRGGMGAVYRGKSVKDGQVEVVKVIHAGSFTPMVRKRFEREARALQLVSNKHSPHIVTFYNFASRGSVFFFAMEYIGGSKQGIELEEFYMGSFDNAMKSYSNYLDYILEIVYIFLQLLHGLKIMHESNLVNRDIKPANIMVYLEKGLQYHKAKIIDFGLVYVGEGRSESTRLPVANGDSKLTTAGSVLGTPLYMSPEQCGGEAKFASDIFSIGTSLYRVLSNMFPFDGDKVFKVMDDIMTKQHVKLVDVVQDCPLNLSHLVDAMLIKDPDRRISINNSIAWLFSVRDEILIRMLLLKGDFSSLNDLNNKIKEEYDSHEEVSKKLSLVRPSGYHKTFFRSGFYLMDSDEKVYPFFFESDYLGVNTKGKISYRSYIDKDLILFSYLIENNKRFIRLFNLNATKCIVLVKGNTIEVPKGHYDILEDCTITFSGSGKEFTLRLSILKNNSF